MDEKSNWKFEAVHENLIFIAEHPSKLPKVKKPLAYVLKKVLKFLFLLCLNQRWYLWGA